MVSLFNTLTRKKEEFKPIKEGSVFMYHCGPTVYGPAHIGNLRSFVTWDILRRVFELNSYKVNQVMNITDIDDKTIKRSREENIPLKELANRYTDLFLEDIGALNILRPHTLSYATKHIEDMVSLIEKLLDKGYAYKTDDNSIYFKVSAFKDYGKLARLNVRAVHYGAPSSSDEYEKEDIRDFALWKAWVPDDGEVFWNTKLGKGRPGWHIECSAMSMKYLGEEFDIHTGGQDLIFPHHTNEIAQSEGATGRPLAHYWLHNGFVLIDGKKMAKSEGNVYTLADVREHGFSPLAYRYWLLTAHYRTLVNFTWEALGGASHALSKLIEHYKELGEEIGEENEQYAERFRECLDDDLDTPRALALLWEMLKDASLANADKKATLLYFDEVFGLGLGNYVKENIPQEVQDLAEERERARHAKDWKMADSLRLKIEKLGFTVKDTPEGSRPHKL